jgi:predicted dehydrogenase
VVQAVVQTVARPLGRACGHRGYRDGVVVRVGFLGAGLIARYHAMQIGLAPEACEVSVVHDPDAGRAERFAEAQGARSVDSVEEVLDLCDVVFVCTWTAAHRGIVEEVAAAGLPVFCEKPLGVDLADAVAVAGAALACPVNAVGLVLRTSPALLAVRELLEDPESGELMAVVFRDDQYIPVQGMYESTWRGDPARCGSGTLLEHSIHDVDLLEWLAGPIRTVAAQQSFHHGIPGIEDCVSTVGRFESGATFTLTSVWHDVLDRPSQRRMELFCRNRLITLEGDVFGPVHLHSDAASSSLADDELVDWLRGRGVALRSTESALLAAVDGLATGRSPEGVRPDARDALRAHVLVDSLYRSADAGGVLVEVPPGIPPIPSVSASELDRSSDPSPAPGGA